MKIELTERDIALANRGLNLRGVSEVVLKVESGKVTVLQVKKEKIS